MFSPVRLLQATAQSSLSYAVKTVPLVIIPAMIIALAVFALFEAIGFEPEILNSPNAPLAEIGTGWLIGIAFFGYVILSPVVETLMMAAFFWIMTKLRLPFWPKVGLQTGIWVFLHSLLFPTWGITIAWAFFLFSVMFLYWQRDKGTGLAILTVSLVHGGNNLIAFALSLFAGGLA